MSCLLCLRNEGIVLFNESSNEFEILLNLLKLPQEFSDTLQGNQCCSLCRVKLEFVGVINHEIGILSQKLKYFEEEVKEIFVSSFNGDENAIESDGNPINIRKKLLKELNIRFPTQHYEEEDNLTHEGIEILPIKVEALSEFSFDNETEISDLFISHNEAVNSSADVNSTIEHDNDPLDQISSSISKNESTKFASFHSFPSTDLTLSTSSGTETCSMKLGNFRKRKRSVNKSLATYHFSSDQLAEVPSKRTFPICICNIPPINEELDQSENFEIQLRTFHPSEFYAKCPECNRIILEKVKSTCENSYFTSLTGKSLIEAKNDKEMNKIHKGRKKGSVWIHFEKVGDSNNYTCLHCKSQYYGNATKLQKHYNICKSVKRNQNHNAMAIVEVKRVKLQKAVRTYQSSLKQTKMELFEDK